MSSESERRLIDRFSDGSGRARRPAALHPDALKRRTPKKAWWISVAIWWALYFVLALALEGNGLTTDQAVNAAFPAATVVAVTYLIVWNIRGRNLRKLAQQWEAVRLAQAKLDGDLFDNDLERQLEYASNLASSHNETLKGEEFGLRGILWLDRRDEDSNRPAFLLLTDKSILITIATETPHSIYDLDLPREHYRIDFMDDYPTESDPRPLWGMPSYPDCIILRINGSKVVHFRSLEPDDDTAEFLHNVELEANRVRENTYLPPLSDLFRGPRPAKRLVRDAYEAEEMVAQWVRWLGWPDAWVTPATGDGGIDVIGNGPAGLAVAQVKFEAKPTGTPQLNALFGAGHGKGATSWLFFNSAGYSRQAIEWADEVGISLFRFTFDGDIEPVNWSAEDLFR